MKLIYLALIPITISISGCPNSSTVIGDPVIYKKEILSWQQSRLERLKGETGWLNLAGLYWLEEGKNRFGSDPSNDIIFPEKARAYCGTLTLKGGSVMLQVEEGIDISSGNSMVYHMELENDQSKKFTCLQQGDLSWNIIKRGEKYGIRLRDYKHPHIDQLDHIPSYPIQTEYVVEATLVPFKEPKTMTVATPVEGYTEEYSCPGELHFRLNRKNLVLFPFTSGKGYFLVIADETTGLETYGAGRFMYAVPDSTGRIILDFNKAYNPPCAFNDYSTCPLPVQENRLDLDVTAGEKDFH